MGATIRGGRLRAPGVPVLLASALFVALGLSATVPPEDAVAQGKGGRKATGSIVLRIAGLPRGERGLVTVVGPRQGRRLRTRFHREIARLGTVRLRGLRAGRYRLRVSRVELRRRHGTIKRGASAFPVKRQLRVRVKRGRRARVTVRYGTIRNPGVRRLRARVVRVLGSPRRPRGLVLRGNQRYRRGMVLTAPPGRKLRRGLLARVLAARERGPRTVVTLRPASIYEAAPNARFRTRLRVSPRAATSQVTCDGLSGVTPYARISNVWADGGWTTSNVWPFGEIRTGARVNVDFDVSAGVEIAAALGVSCSLALPGFTVQGFATAIPIYGSIKPTVSGSVGAGARMRAGARVRVNTSASVSGLPPSAVPRIGFGSPEFEFSDEVFADVGLGIGIGSEVGVGVSGAANLHVGFGNNLEFRVGSGACRWDLKLGTFSATGMVGRWSISTPSTPPLYAYNLWQVPCSPPPLSVPLTRAEMEWGTDADVDLYAWDEDGSLAYFGEQTGISDAELVEDIIPDEGETSHDPEVFRETERPGRRYTFGVCLFAGDSTDVTLTVPSVPDPRGAPRTFPVSLDEVGDSEVVTTSPEGEGYSPPSDWCRSVAG